MSPASYRAAPPRVGELNVTAWGVGRSNRAERTGHGVDEALGVVVALGDELPDGEPEGEPDGDADAPLRVRAWSTSFCASLISLW